MRIKVFSLFLATQVLSFGVWHHFYQADVASATPNTQFYHQESERSHLHEHDHEDLFAAAQDQLKASFLVRNFEQEDHNDLYQTQKAQVEKVLNWLPEEHADSIEKITFNYDPEAQNRGLGGFGRVILGKLAEVNEKEMLAVFIHEAGHNYVSSSRSDEPAKLTPFYDGDTQLKDTDRIVEFFKFSWADNETEKPGSIGVNFVSRYARTNNHEDFAESYALFVIDNERFALLAEKNEILAKKYAFLRDEVFGGMTFETGGSEQNPFFRDWDVTKRDYDPTLLWDA